MTKSSNGNFFEDFRLGMEIIHAVPRTVTTGDVSQYTSIYGTRFAIQSSDAFAQSCGLQQAPVDNFLVFNVVFGKTVPDISLNAVANLGYAECRWMTDVYPGDSLTARSTVIGLRENSSGKTGIVYVRSTGFNQHGDPVLTFIRWVMVQKRDFDAAVPETTVPEMASQVNVEDLRIPLNLNCKNYDSAVAGSRHLFDDYDIGEQIDHIDGMTIEEAEHQIATRLYQNTAKGHFDALLQRDSRYGKRIVYGGHVMSIARALSFNGLANGAFVTAINGGHHASPTSAGDTIYCTSQILDKNPVSDRSDVGALRVRTIASKNTPGLQLDNDNENVVLDLDYWLLMPRGQL
jgi:2-methylfumaryl-CoA hydratase